MTTLVKFLGGTALLMLPERRAHMSWCDVVSELVRLCDC